LPPTDVPTRAVRDVRPFEHLVRDRSSADGPGQQLARRPGAVGARAERGRRPLGLAPARIGGGLLARAPDARGAGARSPRRAPGGLRERGAADLPGAPGRARQRCGRRSAARVGAGGHAPGARHAAAPAGGGAGAAGREARATAGPGAGAARRPRVRRMPVERQGVRLRRQAGDCPCAGAGILDAVGTVFHDRVGMLRHDRGEPVPRGSWARTRSPTSGGRRTAPTCWTALT
jgi:hypothetical protein